jgi:hypothetical protein
VFALLCEFEPPLPPFQRKQLTCVQQSDVLAGVWVMMPVDEMIRAPRWVSAFMVASTVTLSRPHISLYLMLGD